MVHCPDCGDKLEEGHKFCKSCGFKMPGSEIDEPKEGKFEKENKKLENTVERTTETKSDMRKFWLAAIVIIVVLVVVLIFVTSPRDNYYNSYNDGEIHETDTNPYYQNQDPKAVCSANPASGTEPLTVSFLGSGSDTDGYIASYYWTFGDGGTSSSSNPSHTYQSSGTYSAKLTVTDNDGAKDSKSVIITVKQKPDITITSDYQKDVYEGANRVGYVYVTVQNYGGSGSATVNVRVWQGNEYWDKEQSVYLNYGESENRLFKFPQVEFWTLDPWSYTAWVD